MTYKFQSIRESHLVVEAKKSQQLRNISHVVFRNYAQGNRKKQERERERERERENGGYVFLLVLAQYVEFLIPCWVTFHASTL
jgi:hypothetical protein